jgi:hypothetical protein
VARRSRFCSALGGRKKDMKDSAPLPPLGCAKCKDSSVGFGYLIVCTEERCVMRHCECWYRRQEAKGAGKQENR